MPILLILLAASGCCALIYEIVWLQLLELVVGSTATSIAVLLGTFMGGMCIGSLAVPRLISARARPLRVYAALELLTAVCGILLLFGLPYVSQLRGLVCVLCLLPPTILMGATLPVMSRLVPAHRWGYLYAANTVGGVVGCLAAGFWLLRVYDMSVATYVAAAMNVGVAVAALLMRAENATCDARPPFSRSGTKAAYVAIALSGVTALGAEVIWTRLLSLTLGPTVYTFSIILAVFLIGIATGSGVASRIGKAANMLAWCQLGLIAAIAWAGYMIADCLPYWDKNLSVHANPWAGFLFDFVCCVVAILPASVLWGASFSFALDAVGGVAGVYAANTAGAIAGAVLFSLVMIPWLGSQGAERWLVAIAGIAAVMLLVRRRAVWLCGAALLAIWFMPAIPWKLIAFGRRMPMESGPWKKLYAAEGINSSIAYSEWVDKRRFFHVSGKVEASSGPADMQLQRMLGHVPALLHPDPRSVLIVGCGAGVTAGTFVVHPQVARITLCEIEPLIPPASARFFANENNHVVEDKRTKIVYDDARHFVLTTQQRFDIITSDPIHPWVKGAATLYSKEYFEMCRRHLNPGGFVTQWVPLYETDLETVKSEIATFFEVFPNSVIWGNIDLFDQGYDVVVMGSNEAIRIDVDAVRRRFAGIRGTGFVSSAELLGTYAAQARDLRGWLAHAQINSDRSLRLQYLAGMAFNQAQAGSIYGKMLRNSSSFPTDIFTGSAAEIAAVKKSFGEWRN